MKTAIWKFPLGIKDEQKVTLPVGSNFMSLGEQNHEIVMWFSVNPFEGELRELRHFVIVGTGHEIENYSDLTYLQTVQMSNGLVWHVFENRHKREPL